MFFTKIDLISPKITLFCNGRDQHFNFFSGFLALIAYGIIFASSIYFSMDFFLKQHPTTAIFFKKFVEDAGIFPFNSSSIFHYVTFGYSKVDFESIHIIGTGLYISIYELGIYNLSELEHWEYGNCETSDMKGLEHLINVTDFYMSACIKKVWSVEDQRYYSQEDEKFYYPVMKHGASNPNTTNYGIVIQRCSNKTTNANYHCKNDKEFEDYIYSSAAMSITMVDNYIDVGNYSSPCTKFLYKIYNGIFLKSYTQNHLNFNPALIKTHSGKIFDNIDEKYSYVFEQNEKIFSVPGKMQILGCFYFWMQNRLQHYERSYLKMQDVLANIGGVSKLILAIAVIINYFFNYYAIVFSTSKLFQLENWDPKFRENNQKKQIGNNSGSTYMEISNNSNLYKRESVILRKNGLFPNNPNLQGNDNTINIISNKILNLKNNKPLKFDVKFCKYFKSIYCSKCMKDKKIKSGYEMLINFRKIYLSEEFLSQNYLYFENLKSSEKKSLNNLIISRHFCSNRSDQMDLISIKK